MSLPEKFKFKHDRNIYDAEKCGNKISISYNWTTDKGNMSYSLSYVERLISDGTWKIIEPNGVDADDNPSYFGREDLEVGMRIKVRNGSFYIAMPSFMRTKEAGEIIIADHAGFTSFDTLDEVEGEIYKSYAAIEVYEAPSGAGYSLVTEQRGALIWKYVPPKSAEQIKLEKEIEQGEKYINEMQAQVAALKQKLASLQE